MTPTMKKPPTQENNNVEPIAKKRRMNFGITHTMKHSVGNVMRMPLSRLFPFTSPHKGAPRPLIARGATPASAADALNVLALLQLRLRHPADTGRVEVCLLGLNAAQATKFLVALFLPFRDEQSVCIVVFQKPVVELLADGFFLIVELVDVSAPLVGDLEHRPLRLVLWDVVCGRVLRVFHLVAEDEEVFFEIAEAFWWRLALGGCADGGHACWGLVFVVVFRDLFLNGVRRVSGVLERI